MKKSLLLCSLAFLALKGINCSSYEIKTDSLPQTQHIVQKPEVSEHKIKKNPAKIKKEIKKPKQTQPKPKKPLELLLENQLNINNILEKSLDYEDEVLSYNVKPVSDTQARIEIFTYDGNNVSKYKGKVRLNKDGKVKLRENKQLNLIKELKKQTFTTENTTPYDVLTNIESELRSKDKINKANKNLDDLLDDAIKSLASFAGIKEFEKKDAEKFASLVNLSMVYNIFKSEQILFTDGLIDKKLDCDLLSLVYLGVAERLGMVNVFIVKAPGHAFVKFKLSNGSFVNIETMLGKVVEDDFYKRNFKMHEDSVKNGVFMKNLSKKEIKGMVYNNVGLSLIEKKQFDKALDYLDKAIDLYPKLTDAYNHKGICLIKLNSLDKALKCFDKALELDPCDSTLYNNKGDIYFAKKDFEKAAEYYDTALKHSDKKDPNYETYSENKKLAEKYLKK